MGRTDRFRETGEGESHCKQKKDVKTRLFVVIVSFFFFVLYRYYGSGRQQAIAKKITTESSLKHIHTYPIEKRIYLRDGKLKNHKNCITNPKRSINWNKRLD